MKKNDEELNVNKQEETLSDGKKINLYINKNNNEEEKGIDIMSVFSTMKKRFHIYVFVIIITLIAGLLVPILAYSFKTKNETAISILGLDYKGAEEGLAPDGSNLDISYLKSSYIIQNALKKVVLSKDVSVALVQSNLNITAVLTDETKRELEILNKLSADKSSEYAKIIQNFTYKYKAQYIISLDSVFQGDSAKIVLSSNELSHLLDAIIDSYEEFFIDTYQDKILPNNYIGAIDTETLDYLDILDEIQSSLTYLESYCNTKATIIPDFRLSDGISFDDLSTIIHTIKTSDIDYIYSYIYLNNISKDPETQLTRYKYQKREAAKELSEVNASIATVQNSINNYKSDEIVVSSIEGNNQPPSVKVTSDYYNGLVLELTSLNSRKSSLEERILILDNRIGKMTEGTPATEDQIEKAEAYVSSALTNAQSVYQSVSAHAVELFSSNAYKNQYMHSITTSESGSALKDSLKSIGIGAVAGLFIGLLAWVVDAFIIEIKRNKKENGKARD